VQKDYQAVAADKGRAELIYQHVEKKAVKSLREDS